MSELVRTDFFPDEAFDSEVPESSALQIATGSHRFMCAMKREQARVTGSDEVFLTHEQEFSLARTIQYGLEAEHGGQVMSESERNQAIAAGKQARQDLFTVNMRFAGYVARASMGIEPSSSDKTVAAGAASPRYVGAIIDVRKLANGHGNLDDRTQVALEAMWKATAKFKPRVDKDNNMKSARFMTFAAYQIEADLSRYCMSSETTGWYLSESVISRLDAAAQIKAKSGTLPHYRMGDTDEARDMPRTLEQARAGQVVVSFDALSFTAPEEANEFQDGELGLEDFVPAPDEGIRRCLERLVGEKVTDLMHSVLSQRELHILAARLELDDGRPKTYAEIGETLGITRTRAHQINEKALSKLRHTVLDLNDGLIGKGLHDFYANDGIEQPTQVLASVAGVPHVKTERVNTKGIAGRVPKVEMAPLDSTVRHKSMTDEEWNEPLRTLPVNREVAAYQRLQVAMNHEIFTNAWKFRDTSVSERVMAHMADNILENCSMPIAAAQVAASWNNNLSSTIRRLERSPGGFSVDRLVDLYSNLLAKTMTVEDEVELTIPPYYEGRFHGIAAGVRAGKIIVRGDVGDRAAEGAGGGGLFQLHVIGNAGDFVGRRLQGKGSIIIDGNVGDYLGANMASAAASILVNGNARRAVGYYARSGSIEVDGHVDSVMMPRGSKITITAGHIDAVQTVD